ncbi:hypothetical protein NQ317_013064 [Molorchus minor]|uniref:PH domain-containing protein n=1 Tax=Molorchus minor TaxID=1323400 RepID=A0ABQ9IRP6_9CUCU|nr:hypothetical protein NQ317_013064 [Molorchus minor]
MDCYVTDYTKLIILLQAVIFDEIELTDLCLAECSTKNVNHSFQVITPFRSLVLCCESRREMEEWLGALTAASQRRYHEPDHPDCLSGQHHCQEVVNEYINLTKLCMKQNCFQFNNSFFEQHEGTAMGNSLSPFIANLFMSRFETDIKEEFEYFPRIWIRYVDDIFAVFDTKVESVDSFISKLNSRFTSVNFTYEIENNAQLPFLDVLVIKNNQNNLEFDIYRKDTSTLRYIPNDSHHCYQHKMASLNFLIHRLLSFPLSKERFEKERKLIKDIAKINGYSENCVDRLIMKRTFKETLRNSSTFQTDTESPKFVSIPYAPQFTRGLSRIFKNIGLTVIHPSGNKLQQLLGNPKDTIGVNGRSGIYEISCKDCTLKYVGQTRRSILTRFKEHMAHLKYGRTDKSSVAQHAFDNNHRIDINNLKLIRNVTNNRQLDAFESLEIVKCKNRMNSDSGPIPNSPLYWLVRRGSLNREHSHGSLNRDQSLDDANLVGETRVECEKSVLVFVEENYSSVRATSKVPAPP